MKEKENALGGVESKFDKKRGELLKYLDEVEDFFTQPIDVKARSDARGIKAFIESMEREGYKAELLFTKISDGGASAELNKERGE